MSDGVPYDVSTSSRPALPRLRGEAVLREDADHLIDALLADIFIHAGNCVRAFGDFHLAIRGCRAVEPVLLRLLYDPSYRDFPWSRTRLWSVAEHAPAEGPGSAWSTLNDTIVAQSGIPPEQAHAIASPALEDAQIFASLMREHLGWRAKGHDRLDLVLLTLDADGGLGVLPHESTDLVVVQDDSGSNAASLSMGSINAARFVAVYASGEAIRPSLSALSAALHRPRAQRPTLPALGLAPRAGELRWYLDHAACPTP